MVVLHWAVWERGSLREEFYFVLPSGRISYCRKKKGRLGRYVEHLGKYLVTSQVTERCLHCTELCWKHPVSVTQVGEDGKRKCELRVRSVKTTSSQFKAPREFRNEASSLGYWDVTILLISAHSAGWIHVREEEPKLSLWVPPPGLLAGLKRHAGLVGQQSALRSPCRCWKSLPHLLCLWPVRLVRVGGTQ